MRKQIIILLICLLTLTGCWDRREVNDIAFVIATAFDKLEENTFRVAVQVPLPSAMGEGTSGSAGGTSGGPFYVDSGIGRNVRESNDDLQKRMSRQLYFGHRRVLVFGEKLAREGFKKSLDVVLEQPQSRLSSYVLVVKGEAIEVLNSTPHLEQLPAEAMREMAKARDGLTVKNILNDLNRPGKDPVLPVVTVVKTKNGKSEDKKEEINMDGYGILKHDQLKFFTTKQETSGTLWLLGHYPGQLYTFEVSDTEEVNVYVNSEEVNVDYKIRNDVPEFTISINVSAAMEQNEPNFDMAHDEEYERVMKSMEKQIKEEVQAILEHSTSEGIDIYGLGWSLYRTKNFLWENKYANRWEQILPELEINIVVNADIKRTINSGINVRDDVK